MTKRQSRGRQATNGYGQVVRTDEPLPPLIIRAEHVLRGLRNSKKTPFVIETEKVLQQLMSLAFMLEMERDSALELAATTPMQ